MNLYQPDIKERAALEPLSVCILTPCGGYQNWARFTKSVVNLVAYSWLHGLKVYQMGITERMAIEWARNSLARQVKDKINEYTGARFSHLLWLDDDHVFNPDLALYLARSADKDLVSALYYARSGKPFPTSYVRDESDPDPYKHFPLLGTPERLCEVDAVGLGACLMRRDVLDRVPEPWFTLDYRGGEDIAFCVAAKAHGVRVWVDGRYVLGHIGDPEIVTRETFRAYMRDHADDLGDQVRVAV